MQKIPTLFARDPDDLSHVLPEVIPGCEWVLAGEGRATRKWDGTCMRLDDADRWWARREIQPGKPTPDGFEPVQTDPNTGKTVGWEPAEQSPFARYQAEAATSPDLAKIPGTFELIGPKINGNPEHWDHHMLVRHGMWTLDAPRDFDGLQQWLLDQRYEGIVWHHDDGRMAKLKRRDFA